MTTFLQMMEGHQAGVQEALLQVGPKKWIRMNLTLEQDEKSILTSIPGGPTLLPSSPSSLASL